MGSLTILFVQTNGNENNNSCQRLGEELRERGHDIIYAIDIKSRGLLIADGKEIQYSYYEESIDYSHLKTSEMNWEEFKNLSKFDSIDSQKTCVSDNISRDENMYSFDRSPIEIVENFCFENIKKNFQEIKERQCYYEKLIERVKPDIIIIESMICSPALTNSGIPWIWLNFGAPNLCLNDQRIPPAWSGLPANGAKREWLTFKQKWNELFKDLRTELNEWLALQKAPQLPQNVLHPHSPHLNIYIYPKELDYKVLDTLPPNWVQIDCLMAKTNGNFTIPPELKAKPGKLIYLSMGEFAGLELMKRLTTILAKSPNKFIVSKGPFHDKYVLPDNMWGSEMLPQTDVIPLVDLVITNGDNKTISEAFYFSKPLIVMPLFGDQLDNGQRIKENGFGLSVNPYNCSLSTILGSIDNMLDDLNVNRRMSIISDRMQNMDAVKHASVLIENILNK